MKYMWYFISVNMYKIVKISAGNTP